MQIIENNPIPIWLLDNSKGRRLLVAVLRLEPTSLDGTRFQFLRNHPLIRVEIECPTLPRTKAFESSNIAHRQRKAILDFLKLLVHKKTAPRGGKT